MLTVLTKPAEYPDFVLGPGVIVDLPEHEAQRLFEAQAAVEWAGAPIEFGPIEFGPIEFGPIEFGKVKRKPRKRKRRR
ncbi:MAG TPA: hypothetical protein VF306_10425 [Pirellulales bacterium]